MGIGKDNDRQVVSTEHGIKVLKFDAFGVEICERRMMMSLLDKGCRRLR